jgi:hypothetical protein
MTLIKLALKAMDEDSAASAKFGTTIIIAQHRFLCHPDGAKCEDGCDLAPDPVRLAIYNNL